MWSFKRKVKNEGTGPANVMARGHSIIVNPDSDSDVSYERHKARYERLNLAIDNAEARGDTKSQRFKNLQLERTQRELAILSIKAARTAAGKEV